MNNHAESSINYVRMEVRGGPAKSELARMGGGRSLAVSVRTPYIYIFFSQVRYEIEIK